MHKILLKSLFGTEIRGQVLQFFYEQPGIQFQQREVEFAIRSPPGRLSRLLREYAQAGVLCRTEERKIVLYQAPALDVRLRPLIVLFQQESTLIAALQKALKRFKPIEY